MIRRRRGRSLHDPLRPDVDAGVLGEGSGVAGAVPVAEGVDGAGGDIETQAAGALEGFELGGRGRLVVPIEGDGDVAVGPQGIDDGLEGGAEAVVAAPGGGWGDEVLFDGEAEGSEGGQDLLVDLDEEDAGGEGAVAEQVVEDVDVESVDIELEGVGAARDAGGEEGNREGAAAWSLATRGQGRLAWRRGRKSRRSRRRGRGRRRRRRGRRVRWCGRRWRRG